MGAGRINPVLVPVPVPVAVPIHTSATGRQSAARFRSSLPRSSSLCFHHIAHGSRLAGLSARTVGSLTAPPEGTETFHLEEEEGERGTQRGGER